jgi:hypothetical protein
MGKRHHCQSRCRRGQTVCSFGSPHLNADRPPLHSVTGMADKLGVEFAIIHKKRNGNQENAPEQMELLVGDVRGKVRP